MTDATRPCPVCGSLETGAGWDGKVRVPYPRKLTYEQTTARQWLYKGNCSCNACGSYWQERYYVKEDVTVNVNIEKHKFAKDGE